MSRHDIYFAAWAFVLPVTSVLLFPSIQGTTPGYLFALAAISPPVSLLIIPKEKILPIFYDLALASFVFVALNALAQLSLAFSTITYFPLSLPLVDSFETDNRILMRRTMFTQSLYLLAGASTFFFVKHLYRENWDKYFFVGATVFALYGVYECLYFLATGDSGDFLSNRIFESGQLFGDTHTGSWFQTIHLGPLTVQRLKSLTSEPSMYAFTILPYWIYALHTKRTVAQGFLLITLVMSTTTTAVLGICTYLLIRLRYYGLIDRFVCVVGGILIVLLAMGLFGNEYILNAYAQIIEDKVTAENQSGAGRFATFMTSWKFFVDLPLANQLFGVGYGYIRANDYLSTLFVNLGISGFLLTTLIFVYPVVKLGRTSREIGIRAALIVIFVTMMIAKAEFSLPFIWLFLGIAYNEIKKRDKSWTPNLGT
ncbi:MAG: hypothetical protein ACHBNF_04575 [Chromatiales bacterium]